MLKTCLKEKTFDKGEILFFEGQGCERIFIVQTGRVKMYRTSSSGREQILEILEPGDACACNPGTINWACGATAEALLAVKVWYFPRQDYIHMVQTNSKISHTLNRLFAEKIKKFSGLIEEVSLKDTKKRLVKFLLDMVSAAKSSHQKTTFLEVPFTREEIAQRIGTARETVARNLYQLKKAKLIDIKPKQISILNKEGLERLLI